MHLFVPSGLEPLHNYVNYNVNDFHYLVRVEIVDLDLRSLGVKVKKYKAPTTAEECYSMNFLDSIGEEMVADFAGRRKSLLDIDLNKLKDPGTHVAIHIAISDPHVELMNGDEFAGKHITVGAYDVNDPATADPQQYLKNISGLDPIRPAGGKKRSTVFACKIIKQSNDCFIPFNLGLFVSDRLDPKYVLPVFIDPKVKNNG